MIRHSKVTVISGDFESSLADLLSATDLLRQVSITSLDKASQSSLGEAIVHALVDCGPAMWADDGSSEYSIRPLDSIDWIHMRRTAIKSHWLVGDTTKALAEALILLGAKNMTVYGQVALVGVNVGRDDFVHFARSRALFVYRRLAPVCAIYSAVYGDTALQRLRYDNSPDFAVYQAMLNRANSP
jgi:hypothetical protein